MAFSAFMQISGVVGETTTSGFEQWIELTSLNHGVKRQYEVLDQSARVTGDRRHTPISVIKRVDNASPILMRSVCQGTRHDINIQVCRAAREDQLRPYIFYELKECVLLSIDYSAAEGLVLPVETVTFGFTEITYRYEWWDHNTGRTYGSSEFVDDLRR